MPPPIAPTAPVSPSGKRSEPVGSVNAAPLAKQARGGQAPQRQRRGTSDGDQLMELTDAPPSSQAAQSSQAPWAPPENQRMRRVAALDPLGGKALQSAQIKLALRMSQEVRGIVMDHYMILVASPTFEAIKVAGTNYQEAVQKAGRGHEYGAPGPHRGRALLALLESAETTALKDKEILHRFLKDWEDAADLEGLQGSCPIVSW